MGRGGSAFRGEFYEIPAGVQAPVPVQPGGPPILLGGLARPALERAGRIADGWVTSSRTDLSRVGGLVAIVRESAEAAGRDPAALRIICRGVVRAGRGRAGRTAAGSCCRAATPRSARTRRAWPTRALPSCSTT